MTKISRKRKHFVMLPLCALFYFIGAVTVQAATYYAATTGNDAQTCATAQTITTPKRTIAAGVACLNPGDTLYMRAGTWTEKINIDNKTGTPGNYITIAGYPGEVVTNTAGGGITGLNHGGSYFIIDNLVFDGVNSGNGAYMTIGGTAPSHDITIKNCEIKNFTGNGLLIIGLAGTPGPDNIKIQNNRIHDQKSVDISRWYGIYYSNGTNGLIEGNEIYNNPGGGIHAYPGPSTNLVIRGNKIHDNNFMVDSSVGGIIIIGHTDSQAYNNLVYNNGSAPTHGTATGIRVAYRNLNVKLWNNTVYGNAGYGIQVQGSDSQNTVIQNNIAYANSVGPILNGGTNTTLDHNLTTDPLFVNAAAFNFTLQTRSPAIDAGVNLSQVPTDFKITPRPQGGDYDIGAYEGGGSSDIEPPQRPVGLAIR